ALLPEGPVSFRQDEPAPRPIPVKIGSASASQADATSGYAARPRPESLSRPFQAWVTSWGPWNDPLSDPWPDAFSADPFGEAGTAQAGRGSQVLAGSDEAAGRAGGEGAGRTEAPGAREGIDGPTEGAVSPRAASPA